MQYSVTYALSIGLIWLCIWSPAQAFDIKPSDIKVSTSKKQVSVLQNRFFLKALRPEIGVATGSVLNEAYIKTYINGFRTGMFITEWVGVELQYFKSIVKESEDKKALDKMEYKDILTNKKVTPNPEINPIRNFTDINIAIAPFYGKHNFLDYYIVYSDLYLTAGFSNVKTDQGNKTALSFGIGQRLYMYQYLSLRLDFRDRIYKEKRNNKQSTRHALGVDFGISYLFNSLDKFFNF
mgnify:CR=1 FL=1